MQVLHLYVGSGLKLFWRLEPKRFFTLFRSVDFRMRMKSDSVTDQAITGSLSRSHLTTIFISRSDSRYHEKVPQRYCLRFSLCIAVCQGLPYTTVRTQSLLWQSFAHVIKGSKRWHSGAISVGHTLFSFALTDFSHH